jgi:hypothetical protein
MVACAQIIQYIVWTAGDSTDLAAGHGTHVVGQ